MTEEASKHPLAFGKAKRLTRSAEFLRVKSEGTATRGTLMVLGVLKTEAGKSGGFRCGFVTSKRIGSAVVRNRVRRRLREIVRHHQRELGAGIWIVVIARPGAAQASYDRLEDEWLRLAKRAFILAP